MKFKVETVATQYSIERAKELQQTGMQFDIKKTVHPNGSVTCYAQTTWDNSAGEVELSTIDELITWMKKYADNNPIVIKLADAHHANTIEIYDDYRE